ncbi:PP2C family protein-serine/threonine phosphatase [Streptomyces sp. NPDC059740]|uniref:PP2C family protein-serine/threonine phosphatase n=1 Tax=Streptomyces sp. NPDC059740 TaxID=3346926 RepID=UPI003650B32B
MAYRDRTARLLSPRRPAGALVLLPLALIFAIVLTDVLVPPFVHLGPLLVVAPALTASLTGPGLTAAVAAVAVACQLALGAIREDLDAPGTGVQAGALALISVALVFYSRSRQRREAELVRVRSVADAAGRVLLRPPPERMGSLRLATVYRAAGEESRVGGDFYGAVRCAGGTRLLIGDVRGKGLEAMDDTALVLGAFRAAAHLNLSLTDLAAHLDAALAWHNTETGAAEDFATALLVDIPDDGEDLAVLSCGHPPPYVLRSGQARALKAGRPAPPLGLGSLTPDAWVVERHAFVEGETLLLYTDGVIEARDRTGTFYPLAERLALMDAESTAKELVLSLVDDLLRHTGGRLDDDAALLTTQRAR